MKRFVIMLIVLLVFLAGITQLLVYTNTVRPFPTFFWETILFLSLTTFAVFYFLFRSTSGSFIMLYLFTMVLKLLVYTGFCLWVIIQDRENAPANVTVFMIAYLSLTALELVILYPRINR